MPRATINLAYRPLLTTALLTAAVLMATSAPAQLAHKGPAAAIALSKTLAPFDVSSVRQNNTVIVTSWSIHIHGDVVTADDVPLKELIQFAYDVKGDLITGLDGPVAAANFDLMAKVLPGESGAPPKLTDQQLQAMIISLLADRFHLKAHVEQKILPVYDLVVAKGGLKLKLDPSDSGGGWNINGENTEKSLSCNSASMQDLASALSDETDRKVIDKTDLPGHADILLKWSDDVAITQGDPNAISIFTAVEEQLGLKLQPSKGPVDTLVIDHAEMPSAN
jgi:bla regulator protein BlaR1